MLPTTIEFSIHNGNNFALRDVGIGQFYTAGTGLALENASRIDILTSNGTEAISGTLVAFGPQLRANETGQSHIF